MDEKFEYEKIRNENRLLMEVELSPIQGNRFQPTGFPDIGAAEYQRPDGTRMILVESTQSMANRLEATIIKEDGVNIRDDLKGLSYIIVKLNNLTDKKDTLSSSLVEAHRLNSPYIISDKNFREEFKKEAMYEKGKPIQWKSFAKAVFRYDVNSIIHGIFLSNLDDGRLKIPRLISSFIEAEGIREVSMGGVKNNPIDPTGKLQAVDLKKDVYGNVPYHRLEYTANKIMAFFNIDISLLNSYGLGENETKLVLYLSLFKIRHFLNSSLRLRTACDLKVINDLYIKNIVGNMRVVIPSEQELIDELKILINKCKDSFAEPVIISTKVFWKKDSNTPEGNEDEDNSEPNEEGVGES